MGTVLVRIARLAFAGLGIAAIVSAVTATTGSLGNFFSYFTIESNMLAIVVLIVGGLVRGPIAHWYAYPFLDPRHEGGGYGRVALYAVVLAVAMGLLAAGVNAIGRRRGGALGGRHRVTSLS